MYKPRVVVIEVIARLLTVLGTAVVSVATAAVVQLNPGFFPHVLQNRSKLRVLASRGIKRKTQTNKMLLSRVVQRSPSLQ